MKTVNQHIRERLLGRLKIAETVSKFDPHAIHGSERCKWFNDGCDKRMITGACRYGKMGADGKPQYDRVKDMIRRLKLYKADGGGNIEHLMDVRNLAELEAVEGIHPNKHFNASDDGIHTERK